MHGGKLEGQVPVRGVIFDVDGVLLDSMDIWEEAGARYLRSLGRDPGPELGRILFPMTLREGAVYLKETYGLKEESEEIEGGVLAVVRDFYLQEAPMKPGVREFLAELSRQGIPMAAATSSDKEQIGAAFERLGIRQFFRGIATCGEAGEGKNSPAVYDMARKMLSCEREECVVLEDSLFALRTAKAAGFHTVGVFDRFSARDQEALRKQAEIYLLDLTEQEKFWNYFG